MAFGLCAVGLTWALIGGGQAWAALAENRAFAVAATLPNGQVLIAGGLGGPRVETEALSNAELFNPDTDTFSKLTGPEQSLTEARYGAVAAALPNGDVLIAGGFRASNSRSAELFNPATDAFTKLTGPEQSLTEPRAWAVAATLPDGEVLIAGGRNGTATLSSAELFNPATDTFKELTGPEQSLTEPRAWAVAATLRNGEVLIAGGVAASGYPTSAELFNPATNAFTKLTGPDQSLSEGRERAVAATLPNGQVLIAGGINNIIRSTPAAVESRSLSAELFDPITDTFTTLSEKLPGVSDGAVAARLPNGDVLMAGGDIWDAVDNPAVSRTELFNPATDAFTRFGETQLEEEQDRAEEAWPRFARRKRSRSGEAP